MARLLLGLKNIKPKKEKKNGNSKTLDKPNTLAQAGFIFFF